MDSKKVWEQLKKDGKQVRRDAFGVRILTDAEAEARYAAQQKALKESGYETPAQLKARVLREEQEEADRKNPVKIAENQANKSLLELKDELFKYWSGDLTRIAKTYLDTPRDPIIQVPESTQSYTLEQAKEACFNWYDDSGVELSPEGARRLGLYGLAQAKNGLNFSLPSSWGVAFYHLRAVFRPGEVIAAPAAPEPDPEPEPQVDIENIDINTPEGKRAVQEQVAREVRPLFLEWESWLFPTYNHRLTEWERTFIAQLVQREGWNWADRRTWDDVRYWLIRHKYWGTDMLAPHELLKWQAEAEIEKTPLLGRTTSVERARLLGESKVERLRVKGTT